MKTETTIDVTEVAKFAKLATQWWDKEGALKTLHDINPLRLNFIQGICPLSGCRVLDVGCGGGILSEGMAREGALVTGLDVAEDALHIARQHASEQLLSIDYINQPIEHFEAPHFDVVTCLEMLEHVSSPKDVIKHCERLLKPGGYLFLSTINRTFLAYATVILGAEYVLGLLPRQTHDFDKFIKPSELCAMARACDLDLLRMAGLSYNPITRTASVDEDISANYLMVCRKI